jgi:hypothetical protein
MRSRRGKVEFNTYCRDTSLKGSNLHGGELVEQNVHAINIQGRAENESMQSIQLVFGDDGAESPEVDEKADLNGDGGEDKLSTGSGMDVKINLLDGERQKDTAL